MTETKTPPLSVDEALERILSAAKGPLRRRGHAAGAGVWPDPRARPDRPPHQPPKALSAMDGYALRTADGAGPLQVIGESPPAGLSPAPRTGTGGAHFHRRPVPEGADAVLDPGRRAPRGRSVTATAPVTPGSNIRLEGIDFREGETILRRGRRLCPADVALAASAEPRDPAAGATSAHRRAGALATNWSRPAPARAPDQIVASNTYAVLGADRRRGRRGHRSRPLHGQAGRHRSRHSGALKQKVDVLVTIGGASVGDHDLVRGALAREGMELNFWRVAMKPGKPLIHGHIGPMPVLGLPGNPVSAVVCGELFLKPLIRALCGDGCRRADGAGLRRHSLAGGRRPPGISARHARIRRSGTDAGDAAAGPGQLAEQRIVAIDGAAVASGQGGPPGEAGAPVRNLAPDALRNKSGRRGPRLGPMPPRLLSRTRVSRRRKSIGFTAPPDSSTDRPASGPCAIRSAVAARRHCRSGPTARWSGRA